MATFNIPQEVSRDPVQLMISFCNQNPDIPYGREFANELIRRVKSTQQIRSNDIPKTDSMLTASIHLQIFNRSEQLIHEFDKTLYRIRLKDYLNSIITIYWHVDKDDQDNKQVNYVFFENGVFYGNDQLEDFMRTMTKSRAEYNTTRSGKQFFMEDDYVAGYVLNEHSRNNTVYAPHEFRAWETKT